MKLLFNIPYVHIGYPSEVFPFANTTAVYISAVISPFFACIFVSVICKGVDCLYLVSLYLLGCIIFSFMFVFCRMPAM